MVFRTATLFCTALTLLACDGNEKSPPEEKTTAPEKDEADESKAKEAEPAGPFAAWDMDARRKAWQGAHVGPGNSLGQWSAVMVEGDKAKVWDGKEEKNVAFKLQSPCEAKFTETLDDGSQSGWTSHYTIKDGKIVKGLGDAGSRKGKEAVACVSNLVVTMSAEGTCTQWKASRLKEGRFDESPAECRWLEEDGKEYFAVTVRGRETKLIVEGDVLWSEQLSKTHSQPMPDYEAAKAARDAK
ncbi:MAG: hypothetical protein AAGA54_27635 [Myxococcota bacterium]